MAAKCPGMKLGLELRQVAGKPVGGIPQSMLKQIVQSEASPVEMVFVEPDGMISAHIYNHMCSSFISSYCQWGVGF